MADPSKPTDPTPRGSNQPDPATVKAESAQPLPIRAAPAPAPRKNYVPRQTQITPELESLQRRAGKQAYKRAQGRKILRIFAVVAVVWIVLGALLGYVYFGDKIAVMLGFQKDDVTDSNKPTDRVPTVTTVTTNRISSSELLSQLGELDQQIYNDTTTAKYVTCLKKKKLAEQLIELQENKDSVSIGVIEKINSLISLSSLFAEQATDEREIREELRTVSSEYLLSENPLIASYARMGIATATLVDYLARPSDESLTAISACFQSALAELSPQAVRPMLVIIALLNKIQDPQHAQQLKQLLAQKLIGHGDANFREMGQALFDQSVIGIVDVETLRSTVSEGSALAIEELRKLIDAITRSPQLGPITYLIALSTLEPIQLTSEQALERELIGKLQISAAQLSDVSIRENVQRILQQYETRHALIGNQFRFDSGSPAEQPLDAAAEATVIAFLSGQPTNTSNWLKAFANISNSDGRVRYLVVWSESEPLAAEIQEEFTAAMPNAKFIWPPFNQAYLKQCPPNWFPYLVLVDKSSTTLAVGINIEKINDRMAKSRISEK